MQYLKDLILSSILIPKFLLWSKGMIIVGKSEKTVAESKMEFLMLVTYCGSAFRREGGEGVKDRRTEKS